MPIDYTSRDFASVKSDLVARARATIPDWTSTSSPDFTMMLIDLWSYVADVQNYYIDRAYTEAYLDTATQASSVRAIARLMGYLPNPRTSATTTVTVSNSSGAAITIAKGTRFLVPATGVQGSGLLHFYERCYRRSELQRHRSGSRGQRGI